MRKNLTLAMATFAALAWGGSSAHAIEWSTTPNAPVGDPAAWAVVGQDCPAKTSILAMQAGSSLAMLFLTNDMNMLLRYPWDPKQDWRYCTLVVPADLQPGDYTAALEQSSTFLLSLTGGAQASFDAVGTFFGQPIDLQRSFPPFSNPIGPQVVSEVAPVYGPDPGIASCAGLQDTSGFFITTISFTGQRATNTEKIDFRLNVAGASSFSVSVVPVGGRVCNHNGGII